MISEDKETSVMYSRVEPRYNNVPGDWQNLFTITRFCDIEVLFHMFYYYWAWGKENRLLYWGLCYIEVRYIEVPQLYVMYDSHLLIAMHSNGHQHLPPHLSLLLQRDPYRYCLWHLVKKWDWHSWSWIGYLLILWCFLEWGIILILNTQGWQYWQRNKCF